jgi:hypothetical protein
MSEYKINKGINRSVQFKGIKGKYIIWMAAGVLGLFLLFVVMRLVGVNLYICCFSALATGTGIITFVSRISHVYGEFGLMKKMAQRRIPKELRSYSRQEFIKFKK